MRFVNKLFGCAFTLTALVMSTAVCGQPRPNIYKCVDDVTKDANFLSDIKNIFGGQDIVTADFIKQNKAKILQKLGEYIHKYCFERDEYFEELNKIADADSIYISFILGKQPYEIPIQTDDIFDYLENTPTAIWLVNNLNYSPGNTVKKSDVSDYYYFADNCSDHTIAGNMDPKTAVNQAGIATFGSKKDSFAIDLPVSENSRTFPGLLLRATGIDNASYGGIAYIPDYKEARKTYKTFANNLQNNGKCSSTRNPAQKEKLAVYHVKLPAIPQLKNLFWGWGKLDDFAEVVVLSDPIVIR